MPALLPVLGALLSLATATLLTYARQVSAALRDLLNGGPRPPSFPLPANDSPILTRRYTVALRDILCPPQEWSL